MIKVLLHNTCDTLKSVNGMKEEAIITGKKSVESINPEVNQMKYDISIENTAEKPVKNRYPSEVNNKKPPEVISTSGGLIRKYFGKRKMVMYKKNPNEKEKKET